MPAALTAFATSLLILGLGAHDDGFMQGGRSAVKTPKITVAPSGSDATCRRGELSKPCATLNRAYSLARCGDITEVATGSYGSQRVIETKAGSACNGNPIVFRPAYRTRPTFNWIQFGDCSVCFSKNAPDNLTFRGFRVTRGFSIWGDAVNVTLDDIDGGSFFIEGGTNIKIINSDWGPCGSRAIAGDCRNYYPGDGYSGQVRIIEGTNLLFENNTFHDMLQERPGTIGNASS